MSYSLGAVAVQVNVAWDPAVTVASGISVITGVTDTK